MEKNGSFLEAIKADARMHTIHWKGASTSHIFFNLLLRPGFHLALAIRCQRVIGKIPIIGPFVRRVMWYFTTIWFACDIDPMTEIGPGVYFPHPIGIVIGGEWVIGANVSILQGVTLGRREGEILTGRPRVGDGAVLSVGAKVIGAVDIGDKAQIGANAVVLQPVPAGWTAVGVPARMIPPKETRGASQPSDFRTH